MSKIHPWIVACGVAFISNTSAAETIPECLQRLVVGADGDITVEELRARCEQIALESADNLDTVAEKNNAGEQAVARNRFTLLQHKQNYLLPASYNFDTDRLSSDAVPGEVRELDDVEFKFQISFKSLLWDQPFGSNSQLYASYTNTSWWQAYNRGESSPFRETNHQPEFFLDVPSSLSLGDWELTNMRFGVSHISNGRTNDFSRTWNRVYAEFVVSNERNEIRFKPWSSVSDIEDNPDIDDFAGKFSLEGEHLIGDSKLGWEVRHTLDSNNRGSIELDWSKPIAGRDDLMFFVQYFNGYGESLIDYNIDIERLGIGFKLGG